MMRFVARLGLSSVSCLVMFSGLVWATSAQEATPQGGCPATSDEENIALVEHWVDAWDSGDTAAFEQVVSDDYVHGWSQGQDTLSEAEFVEKYPVFAAGLTGMESTIHTTLAEEGLVAISWTTVGTHEGALFGIEPTGETVSWTGITFYRIECGEIVESWTEMDIFGILQQVGLPGVPATPSE